MKPNKILILHGWEANSQSNWFRKAKDHFEAKGYEVYAPDCPGEYFPKFDIWISIVKNLHLDDNWILIGHSLGGVTIMRYLEEAEKPVAQVILAATPIEPMKFDPIANFFPSASARAGRDGEEFDYEKIKSNTLKINLIYEADDPAVPLEHGNILAKKLNAPLMIVSGGSHMHQLDMNKLDELIV